MKNMDRFVLILIAILMTAAGVCFAVAAAVGTASPVAGGRQPDPGLFEELAKDALVVGDGVTPPKLVEKVQPVYPVDLRGAEGKVVLQAIIEESGLVSAVEFLKRSEHAGFDEAARDAVRRWRYDPALKDGAPVKVRFTVVVSFAPRKVSQPL